MIVLIKQLPLLIFYALSISILMKLLSYIEPSSTKVYLRNQLAYAILLTGLTAGLGAVASLIPVHQVSACNENQLASGACAVLSTHNAPEEVAPTQANPSAINGGTSHAYGHTPVEEPPFFCDLAC